MGLDVLIPLLAIFSVIFVPVTGLMIILTSRFALKPLVETLATALKESGYAGPGAPGEELRSLAEQIEALTEEVRQLKEVSEFDRKLLHPGEVGPD